MINPLRTEDGAFRALLYVAATAAVILVIVLVARALSAQDAKRRLGVGPLIKSPRGRPGRFRGERRLSASLGV